MLSTKTYSTWCLVDTGQGFVDLDTQEFIKLSFDGDDSDPLFIDRFEYSGSINSDVRHLVICQRCQQKTFIAQSSMCTVAYSLHRPCDALASLQVQVLSEIEVA